MHAQFADYMLTDEGKRKAEEIAKSFDDLLTKLEALCPEGRHLALVRTNLETACFYAKKAMSEKNCQETEPVEVRGGLPKPSPAHQWDGALERWFLPSEPQPMGTSINLGHTRHG